MHSFQEPVYDQAPHQHSHLRLEGLLRTRFPAEPQNGFFDIHDIEISCRDGIVAKLPQLTLE